MSSATRSSGVRRHVEEEVEAHDGSEVRKTLWSNTELGPDQRSSSQGVDDLPNFQKKLGQGLQG